MDANTDCRDFFETFCIQVESKPAKHRYGQLGHNSPYKTKTRARLLTNLEGSKDGYISNPNGDNLFHKGLKNELDKHPNSILMENAPTIGQYHRTTAGKHLRAFEKCSKSADWETALIHINQCVNLVPQNSSYYIKRAELYLKLFNYSASITNYQIALSMPMSPKAFDWEDTDIEKFKQDGIRSHHGVSAYEWKFSLLRLSQIHLMFGRHLLLENKPGEALSHFNSARHYTDQFCRMKRQFASTNNPADGRTNYLSPGSMITLSDFLKVYEILGQYNQYLQLVTACIGYLESKDPINYPQEYFEQVYGDNPEVTILDLPDLLCLRAQVWMKQSVPKLTEAYQDLKKAISTNSEHSEANRLMSELIGRSKNYRETACLMILKNRPEEALHYIRIAILAQPESALLRFDHASLLRRLGQLEEALEYVLQGVYLLQSRDNQEDRNWFRRNTLNELFYILLDMSWTKLNSGQPELASVFLENLERTAPRNILVHLLQGDCEYLLENFPKALELYQKSKILFDEFKNSQSQCTCKFLRSYEYNLNMRVSRTFYSLSLLKIRNKKFQEALEDLTSSIQLSPLIPQYYIIRMRLNYQCNHLEESWKDLMACVYLYLGDASLIKRTNGKWTKLPESERHRIRQHLIKQVHNLTGSVLSRLMPKTPNLVQLANSQQCLRLAQQIMDSIPRLRCRWCTELGHSLSNLPRKNVTSEQTMPSSSRLCTPKCPPMNVSGNSIFHSNFELKMIKNDIYRLRKLGKV